MQLVFDFYKFDTWELINDRVRYLCQQKGSEKELNKLLKIETKILKQKIDLTNEQINYNKKWLEKYGKEFFI